MKCKQYLLNICIKFLESSLKLSLKKNINLINLEKKLFLKKFRELIDDFFNIRLYIRDQGFKITPFLKHFRKI